MPHEMSPGKPTTRRYSEAEKQRAVRAVRQLRKELGTDHGTIKRVAEHLGIGIPEECWFVKQGLSVLKVGARARRSRTRPMPGSWVGVRSGWCS